MFRLSFETNNAAFDDAPDLAAADIIRNIAAEIERGRTSGPIHDINGNTIGAYRLTR